MAPARGGSRALVSVRRPARPSRLVPLDAPAPMGRCGLSLAKRNKRRRTQMRRLLLTLVASLVLGLVGGVGPAFAGDLLSPSSQPGTSQTATQSNDGSNSASQTATSAPVVVSGPNVALANGGSCSPCGGGGTTTQNSGNTVN